MLHHLRRYRIFGIALAALAIIAIATPYIHINFGKTEASALASEASATPALTFSFAGQSIVSEAFSASQSASPDWWLASGAELKIQNGVARTLEGSLPYDDSWRKKYAMSTPVESDNGYHPQNVFRLYTESQWQDSQATLHIKVLGDNLFNPVNSNSWNGLSLIARYQNDSNYYYLGIRMDGDAVIKKKAAGQFVTLDSESLFPGKYDSALRPDLIPPNQVIGLRSRIINTSDTEATIQLYADVHNNGDWKLVAQAIDNGSAGGKPILSAGRSGIMSDFLDVEFEDYSIDTLGDPGAAQGDMGTDTSGSSGDASAGDTTSATTTDETAATPSDSTTPGDASLSSPAATSSVTGSARAFHRGTKGTGASTTTPPIIATSTASGAATSTRSGMGTTTGSVGGILSGLLSFGELTIDRTLQETGSMPEGSDKDWWLNSGGYAYFKGGIASTVHGDLVSSDPWYKEYADTNSVDTDGGIHPQNLFRLVSKNTSYKNYSQQAYFKIDKYNLSDSSERDGFNGLLFFNRYVDENNLYYAGIRTDGNLEIKKKKGGTYYTMLIAPVFPGTFDRDSNPNLLPLSKWIGVKVQIQDTSDGKVDIKVFVDKDGTGAFTQYGEAVDDGTKYGGAIMDKAASVGIRTDFMDADFKDYQIKAL